MKKIIYLILTASIVAGLVALVFWYKEYKQESKGLIGYVPLSAVAYTEIDLADEGLKKYLVENQKAKDYLEKFILTNEMAVNVWRGEVEIDKMGLVIFLNDEGEKEKAWLIHGRDDVRKLEATELVDYYFATLNGQAGVLTKSKEALEKIRDARPLRDLGRFRLRTDDCMVCGFVSGHVWLNRFEEISKLAPNDNQLEFNEEQDVMWGLNIVGGEIEFSLQVPVNIDDRKNIRSDKNEFILVNNVIYIKDIEFKQVLEMVKKRLAGELEVEWDLFEEYIQARYQVDIKSLYTFFEQPVSLVLKPKRLLVTLEDFFVWQNYNWLVVIDQGGEGVKKELSDLESLIQNYLAFKHPVERIKILPDGSRGVELVAVADEFNWQEIKEKGLEMKVIDYAQGEVVYGLKGQRFVLGNSLELARDVLAAEVDQEGHEKYIMRIDTDMFDNDFLKLGEVMWLVSERGRGKVIIKGRLVD